MSVKLDTYNEPFVMHKEAMDVIIKLHNNMWPKLMALYCIYRYTSQWYPEDSFDFAAALHISKEELAKLNNKLEEFGLIKITQNKDKEYIVITNAWPKG